MEWGSSLRLQLGRWFGREGRAPPLSANELYLMTVHLEIMLRCGLQLASALKVLASGQEPQPRESCLELLRDVTGGLRLSRAMARQPKSFPSSYYRVIETGEATGQMAACLHRLSVTLERQNRTARMLSTALIYPAFLLLSCAAMVMVMLYFVFPMVIKVTHNAGVRPPALTRALMFITGWHQLLFIICGLGLLLVATWVLIHHHVTGPVVRRISESWSPPGRFYARTKVVASVRQLGLMLECGVNLVKALGHARHVGAQSILVNEAYLDIVGRVRQGEPLSQSFARHPVFPKCLSGMLSVSDTVGESHVVLHRVADMLEQDLNYKLNALTTALEPILMFCMGVVVGILLLGAFLPIYSLIKP